MKKIFLFFIFLAAGHVNMFSAEVLLSPGDTIAISVDFSRGIDGVKSVSGFLLSFSDKNHSDDTIRSVQPKLWRTIFPDLCGRIINFSAQAQFVLSDLWEVPKQKNWIAPYDNYQAWDQYVTKTAKILSADDPAKISIDFWNEPNTEQSWKGTHAELFETYCRTYRILREQLGPKVKIGGPSTSGFKYDFIKEFLEYCRVNNCEVNFISWHEWDEWDSITPLAERVKKIRNDFQYNPLYAKQNITEIYINEYSTQREQHSPANLFRYLYYLEKSGVDGACKACWDEKNGVSNCWNNSMNGLLSPADGKPTGTWWMYKYYSEGVNRRVQSNSNDPNAAVLANSSKDNLTHGNILFSYVVPKGSSSAPKDVAFQLQGIFGADGNLSNGEKHDSVGVAFITIPSGDESTILDFKNAFTVKIPVKENNAIFSIPNVLSGQCFFIEILKNSIK